MARSPHLRVLAAFVLGALLGVGGTVAFTRVAAFELVKGPLDHVTVIDRNRPAVLVPRAAVERLDGDGAESWGMVLKQDKHPLYGGDPLAPDTTFRARLGEVVEVPDLERAQLYGVMTNVLDDEAVARHGSLYVLWFTQPTATREWLGLNLPIFRDEATESRRTTFLAGSLAVYYAPPTGGPDETAAIEAWLREVTGCPTHSEPCEFAKKD